MKTGTATKLLFTGIASGIALSCAIVLATSVTTVSSEKSDKSVVHYTADPKADRARTPAGDQEVARGGKSDPLAITLAILKGDRILSDDPVRFDTELKTAETGTPETTVAPVESAVGDLRLISIPDEAETAEPEAAEPEAAVTPVETQPAPRRQTVRVTQPVGDPVSIVPEAEPVENRPVADPTTTTNFTIEPVTSQQSLRDRTDLVR